MTNDPIEVLRKSAGEARRTAIRSATLGDFTRAAKFLRWASRCEEAIADLRVRTVSPTGALRRTRAA